MLLSFDQEVLCVEVLSLLIRSPVNKAVIQGSAVIFQCSSNVNSSVTLWYNSTCISLQTSQGFGNCVQYFIYSGFIIATAVPPRFSVTVGDNATHVTRDLNISPTQLSDAGVYLCAERRPSIGITDLSSAQLIVLGNIIALWICIQ